MPSGCQLTIEKWGRVTKDLCTTVYHQDSDRKDNDESESQSKSRETKSVKHVNSNLILFEN